MRDKTVLRITREELVKSIAKQSNNSQRCVREIFNLLEDEIFALLSSTNEKQDVEIRLFEGITLNGKFMPAKERLNNLNDKVEFVSERIKPMAKISRTYNEKFFSNK